MKKVTLHEPNYGLSDKKSDPSTDFYRAEPSRSRKEFKSREVSPNLNLSDSSKLKGQSSNPFGDSFDDSPHEKGQVNNNPFDQDPDYDESLNPFA